MPAAAFVFIFSTLLCFSSLSFAKDNIEVLPDPLTLDYALSFSDRYHPDLAIVDAEVQKAQADVLTANANDDLDISLRAQAQWIDPAENSFYQQTDNHKLSLLVDKTLYDFGQQASQQQVANTNLQSQKHTYFDARQKRRLNITRRFFDVLLADLLFYRYNEEMASAYVRLDKLRERQKIGQVGELEVLKQETQYQKMRGLRITSRNNQRLTRNALAIALGSLKLIADTLAKPNLVVLEKKLPELQLLQEQAVTQNPALKALRARLTATQQAVAAARKLDNPVLKAELEAHGYSRETGSTDPWRAGLVMSIPLSKGGRTDAKVARQKSNLYQIQAQVKKATVVLKHRILTLWLAMESMKLKRDEARALLDYSELYLDKSRTLYEMEVRSTLGDAMITITTSQFEALKADLDLAYAWKKMDSLTGNLITADRIPDNIIPEQ